MFNTKGASDVRKALSGKDAAIFNDKGTMLATVESYQAQVSVNNGKYQPLGDAQEHELFQSYGVTISFTELVVKDEDFLKGLVDGMKSGQMPSWNIQGVLKGRNGSEERMVYRDCVPSGTIDLQNFTVGDIIKRAWSLFVNQPPDMQKFLRD